MFGRPLKFKTKDYVFKPRIKPAERYEARSSKVMNKYSRFDNRTEMEGVQVKNYINDRVDEYLKNHSRI